MARMPVYRCEVTLAWWWRFYEFGLVTVCIVMGCQPDLEKVAAVARKALRLRLVYEADLDDGVADGE
jgi:hypothetical protein